MSWGCCCNVCHDVCHDVCCGDVVVMCVVGMTYVQPHGKLAAFCCTFPLTLWTRCVLAAFCCACPLTLWTRCVLAAFCCACPLTLWTRCVLAAFCCACPLTLQTSRCTCRLLLCYHAGAHGVRPRVMSYAWATARTRKATGSC